MKNLLIFGLTGALVGIVLASIIAPPALSWYATPGGLPSGTQIQALVDIPEVIRYATGKLMRAQAIGGAAGATFGVVWGLVMSRKRAQLPPAPGEIRTPA